MKKLILFGVITILLVASVGIVMATGPKNAADKNPNVIVVVKPYGTCTFLLTGDGGFQDWWEFKDGSKLHTVCKPITVEPKGRGWWVWNNLNGSWPVPAVSYWCKQSRPSK